MKDMIGLQDNGYMIVVSAFAGAADPLELDDKESEAVQILPIPLCALAGLTLFVDRRCRTEH